ncbi:MAG TPA: hypothetical protein DDW93_01630, partial [Firmicutes bacterium]|nr:hypothetical protein [Bacillota bacterium]
RNLLVVVEINTADNIRRQTQVVFPDELGILVCPFRNEQSSMLVQDLPKIAIGDHFAVAKDVTKVGGFQFIITKNLIG